MANGRDTRCRLCLVTPPKYEAAAFAAVLSDALSGGDVASLIITAPNGNPAAFQEAAEALVPIATARGTAALIHNDTRIAGRSRADGVHIDSGSDELRQALDALRGKKIVGAGGIHDRDEAMDIGSLDVDYLFFGRLDGDTAPEIYPKALDLAEWWSAVTIVPAIVMGGRSLASAAVAAASGIEFVALSAAVWDDPRGAGAAVAEACEHLARRAAETAA